MTLSVATWNINSVRLRLPLVLRYLGEHRPDVLCLQEIKCREEEFPAAAFMEAGYPHMAVHGQKGYHGVAIVSRRPFVAPHGRRDFCGKGDARHVTAAVEHAGEAVTLHNFYIPAGGDEPDPEANDKFAHKLQFLDELVPFMAEAARPRTLLLGDLNVAPLEHDVWSHRQLLSVVSHTPVETEGFERARAAGGWVDLARAFVPAHEKLYTWWSYRAKDWRAADRGRRLDHIWASDDMAGRAEAVETLKDTRAWERASDHVPVLARFG